MYSPASQITSTTAKNFLYVTNLASNTISAFSINTSTGVLTPLSGSPFPTGFSAGLFPRHFGLAITSDDRFLIVTNDNGTQIAVDGIDANGALAPVPGSPFSTPLGFVTSGSASPKATPDGKFLAVASIVNIQAGVVEMFNVTSTGGLIPVPGFGNAGEAVGIECNCASNHLYVGAEFQTRIDAFNISPSGALSPIAGSPFTGPESDARSMLLSPDDSKLFVSNQRSDTITVFSLGPNGALALVPGSPFSTGGVFPGSMATNQAGTFLYAANVLSNSISAFSIAPSGALTLIPGSPFISGASGTSPLSLTVFPPKVCCPAPVINDASATPNVLVPSNHKMADVVVDYAATASCANTCVLTVSSNEPVNGAADGNTSPDWEVIDAHYVHLRAERMGSTGKGRVYTITITCTNDANKLTSSRTVTVRVPFDR